MKTRENFRIAFLLALFCVIACISEARAETDREREQRNALVGDYRDVVSQLEECEAHDQRVGIRFRELLAEVQTLREEIRRLHGEGK